MLVLAFLIAAGAIVGALATSVANDLHNTSNFAASRSLEYAANSATELAIQNIRYTPLLSSSQTLNASPPSSCWGTGTSGLSSIDGYNMAVWCSTAWNPQSSNTRVVTFSTCVNTGSMTAATCAANPTLQAVVTFDDYPQGLSTPTAARCVVYCGTSVTINSWVQSPKPPTVTGITNGATSGPITGGTTVTVTGSGFVAGTTVTFVEESGGTPVNGNIVLPATNVSVQSSTSLTASSPSVTDGTTYFVTVTTPTGTSAYAPGNADVFTFSPVNPTVTGVSPTVGSTAGGTFVTITGTGFVTGATVNFVEESGGIPVSPSVVLPANNITVNTNTSITAVSPAITDGTTYFVTVTTPSATSPTSSNDVFRYSPLVPTVAGITPTSGPMAGGTTVTIFGTGFVTGTTVSFVEESGGTVISPNVILAATGVTVTGATSITAVSPAITVGNTYYVTVTTPTGTSNYYPIFTYS